MGCVSVRGSWLSLLSLRHGGLGEAEGSSLDQDPGDLVLASPLPLIRPGTFEKPDLNFS